MIRRDYILRMIEEFFQALSRIRALKKDQKWSEGALALEEQFRKLLGMDARILRDLSETELLARLIQTDPSLPVREKTLLLSSFLKEAGDLAIAQDPPGQGRAYYLKGLHLLLETLGRGEVFECPEFVPKIEQFVACLGEAPLPLPTLALLMQHYERTGQFGKAEDALYAMLDAAPDVPGLVDFGIAFYQRLSGKSDTSLEEGNLPRAELQSGLAKLRQSKS